MHSSTSDLPLNSPALCKMLRDTPRKYFFLHNFAYYVPVFLAERLITSPVNSRESILYSPWPTLRFLAEHYSICQRQPHCKKVERFLDFSDQTFQGLGLGTLFPARESLVSDIPAGEGKLLNLYLQCGQGK